MSKKSDTEFVSAVSQFRGDTCIILQQRNKLMEVLQSFANFACSERDTCMCNNCIARDLIMNIKDADR